MKRRRVSHRWKKIRWLIERDGGFCRLCGLPIDIRKHGNRPDAVSIDHILPVSRGGTNTLDNLQLAHLACNHARGNELDGEAA